MNRLEIQIPGIEPSSSQAIACRSTLPCDEMAEAGDPQQRGGVEDVRADDPRDRQRIDHHHHETEERAAADGREADDEAEDGADDDCADLVLALQDERRFARLDPRLTNVFATSPTAPSTSAAPIA